MNCESQVCHKAGKGKHPATCRIYSFGDPIGVVCADAGADFLREGWQVRPIKKRKR